MNVFYNDDEKSKFSMKINTLLNDMDKMKKSQTVKWKDDYEILYEKLQDILDVIEGNLILARKQFQELSISKYDSFSNYVYNTDIEMIELRKGNNERTKTLRAKRKCNICPECKHKLHIMDNTQVCHECGYTHDLKSSVPNTRASSDNSKHTYKQLDAITGVKKPPANISKISQYISVWLTDLKFIYKWLVSNNKLNTWIQKYNYITDENINISYFNNIIERNVNNMYSYNVYKLFTDELFLLLENAKRYSKLKSSNMETLKPEEILTIFRKYIATNKNVPTSTIMFEYEGTEYEIGLYINSLKLKYNVPETHIKNDIEKLFNEEITLPGLMFNFNEVYDQSENVPKKYNFTQEYIFCIHETFNVPYIDITPQDKDTIVNLILNFNNFYKNETYKKTGKECNAPLFCCSLSCLITQLPYFHKYKSTLNLIPIKDKGTASHIKAQWFKFVCNNQEMFSMYNNGETQYSECKQCLLGECNCQKRNENDINESNEDEKQSFVLNKFKDLQQNENDNNEDYNDEYDDDNEHQSIKFDDYVF